MSKATIYHNPRCSKSRLTLALLQEKQIELDIVLYLQTPPDYARLKQIITLLGISPRQLLRVSEAEYSEQKLSDQNLSDDDLINTMVKFPRLIERPIVVINDKAVIGRPPENVLAIL